MPPTKRKKKTTRAIQASADVRALNAIVVALRSLPWTDCRVRCLAAAATMTGTSVTIISTELTTTLKSKSDDR